VDTKSGVLFRSNVMAQKSLLNQRRFHFSLRSLFVWVLVCALAVGISINWTAISLMVKYGTPIDLDKVEVGSINTGSYQIYIDGEEFVTYSPTSRKRLINFESPDFNCGVRRVWRSRSNPPKYTLEIYEDFVEARPIRKR